MLTTSFSRKPTTIKFEFANWVATDALPRDCAQSQRLHEPEYRIDTADPMTGEHIKDTKDHPSLVDGNLTIFFSTKESRKAKPRTTFDTGCLVESEPLQALQ